MASTQGKIQLALRNTIDSKKVDPPAVLEAALFAGPAPAPKRIGPQKIPVLPPPLYIIEVISGSKHENKSFPTPSTGHSTNPRSNLACGEISSLCSGSSLLCSYGARH